AVWLAYSCHWRGQPKLLGGASSHACTSATICGVDPQVAVPVSDTGSKALSSATKSPPSSSHLTDRKKRNRHVASPVTAGAPLPPPLLVAFDAPSPQSLSSRCIVTFSSPAVDIVTVSISGARVMVDPAGIAAATSKASSARRIAPVAVLPAKIPTPAPFDVLLLSLKIVLSFSGLSVTSSASAAAPLANNVQTAAAMRRSHRCCETAIGAQR